MAVRRVVGSQPWPNSHETNESRVRGFPCAATYIASSHGIRRHLSYGGVGSWPWVVFGGPLKPTCVEGPDRVSGGDEGPRAMFKCGVRARM